MKDKVIYFIKQFSLFGPQVRECFLQGNCYWFATILFLRFDKSEIQYDEVANHFGCKIENKIYDISGDVTNIYNWGSWNSVQEKDPILAKRIERDCILKI